MVFIGIHTFFTRLNDLERIIRCPGHFKFEEHNVAAHSWKVSQYAMFFATLEERGGSPIDWKSLYEKTTHSQYKYTPAEYSLQFVTAFPESNTFQYFCQTQLVNFQSPRHH